MKTAGRPSISTRMLLLASSLAAATLAIGTVSLHGWLTIVLPATFACLAAAWLLERSIGAAGTTAVVLVLAFVAGVLSRMFGAQGDGSLGRTVLATGVGVALAQAWLPKQSAVALLPIVLALVLIPITASVIVWFGMSAGAAMLLLLLTILRMRSDAHKRWRLVALLPPIALLGVAVIFGVWIQSMQGLSANSTLVLGATQTAVDAHDSAKPTHSATAAASPALLAPTAAASGNSSAKPTLSSTGNATPTTHRSAIPARSKPSGAATQTDANAGVGTNATQDALPSNGAGLQANGQALSGQNRAGASSMTSVPHGQASATTQRPPKANSPTPITHRLWWLILAAVLLLLVAFSIARRWHSRKVLLKRLNSGSARQRLLGAWIWMQRRRIFGLPDSAAAKDLLRRHPGDGKLASKVVDALYAPEPALNAGDADAAWSAAR